jgi:hypothetical protein
MKTATDSDLLRARIEREQALASLFKVLCDVALDLRELIREQSTRGRSV